MSRHSKHHTNDDWIVDDLDDGDISWASQSTPSSSQDGSVKLEPPEMSPLSVKSRSSAHDRVTTAPSVPEFIMPSIADTTNPFRQRVRPQTENRSTAMRESKSRTVSARSTPARIRQSQEVHESSNYLADVAGACLRYTLDVIGNVLRILKFPISIAVTVYVVLAACQIGQNLATNSIYRALSPVCRIPGVSYLDLPICHSPYNKNQPQLPSGPSIEADPEFDALMNVQGQFETIIADTADGVSLPMDMKRSETSIRDLRQIVRFSQLPSRHELLLEFDGFVETARTASYDLQKFNSHVGRGVDIVLSTARWTQRVLDDIKQEHDERGFLPAFISDTILAPFKPLKFTEARLLNQYIEHTHVVSGEIEKLIEEAQSLLQILQNLEDRLEVVHSIAIRDDLHAQGTKDDILAELWTFVGGNKAKLGKVDNQLKLLRQVARYRRTAFDHVANTIIKLQGMSSELEELRERVGNAEVLRDAGHKHVPLSVHIENIQLGVERLEIGRERARALEQQYQRRVLDKADSAEGVRDIRYLDGN